MHFETEIFKVASEAIQQLFNGKPDSKVIQLQKTKIEFEGDITLVVFPLTKISKKSPEETGKLIGEYLLNHSEIIQSFNTVKGFLNLVIKNDAWLHSFREASEIEENFGYAKHKKSGTVVVEYSSPNTNKPLHLGHIRNNLLGWSVAEILKADGNEVRKVNLVNDRGIHICKSMLAWKKRGNGETPQTSGLKGDHLVGKYYVEFDKMLREEKQNLMEQGMSEEEAEKKSILMEEAREMLRQWESGNDEIISLWKVMNGWVYEGFDVTYKNLGVDFDKIYYESETYLLGKKIVEDGLKKNVFHKKPDGSVRIDLTGDGLDEKVVLRSDGTAVYITQDIGTAKLRFDDYHFSKMIYVVGNEQDYHFKVLKLITKKLGYDWSEAIYHLSYGMVDLPSGKMKSREGTVVDADELLNDLFAESERITKELGKIDDFDSEEARHLYHTIGLGALKYFLLRVDPEKRMMFNPAESIDFNGDTGPFIQYTYARIQSVLRKARKADSFIDYENNLFSSQYPLNQEERDLLIHLLQFPYVVHEAAEKLSPALITHFAFASARLYNHFYHHHSIVDRENLSASIFRLKLSAFTGNVIHSALHLLGIHAPERM